MASTIVSEDSGSDHDHWAPSSTRGSSKAVASPGYDSLNGIHSHHYESAVEPKESSPPASPVQSEVQTAQAGFVYAQPIQQTLMQVPIQYTANGHPIVYIAQPGYYALGTAAPVPTPAAAPVEAAATTAPTSKSATPKSCKSKTSTAPKKKKRGDQTFTYHGSGSALAESATANRWMGRTVAEVNEDNRAIAAGEKVYDPRRVAPIDVEDDQPFWVLHPDGSHTLRSYITIKDMEGEWRPDPRYEDVWFFIEKDPRAEANDD